MGTPVLRLGHFIPAPGGAAKPQGGPGLWGKKTHLISVWDLPSGVTALETDCVIMITSMHAKQMF